MWELIILSINRKLKDPTKKLSLGINGIVEIDKLHITDTDFQSNSSCSSSSDSEDSLNLASDLQLSYLQWMCIDSKMQKVTVNSDLSEIVPLLTRKIDELKQHIHTKKEQQTAYNKIKENLAGNVVMVHVDSAVSYENKQQDEVQSAYFGHSNFSLFTACCYAKESENGVLL